ncbi:MAG: VapE domain-containing protein [Acetivibrionales bacterium]
MLKKVRRTKETVAVYDLLPKDKKDKIKNGRAFVGGHVKGGRRKKENIENRWLITLDADNADEDFIFNADLILGGNAYVIYSTHSHRPHKPRYRLIVPMNRALSPDEYGAIIRKLAEKIGMTYFDKTTFEVHRLMYFPSCSNDAEPVLEISEGPFLDADSELKEYIDWQDFEEWPRHPEEKTLDKTDISKLGDPTEKPGVIGVFCQVYGIHDGIQKFLCEIYEATKYDDRWTYTGGTSFGGLRVYDDAWAYSEHQSDPANDGHCHNIFDLVRIHKFGELDKEVKAHTPGNKYPSYKAMLEFAAQDPEVKKICLATALQEFAEADVNNENWEDLLELNPKTMLPLATGKNVELLLRYGDFNGVLAYDAFGNTEVIRGDLPWRGRERPNRDYEPWLGSDDNRLLHYFNTKYNIKSASMIRNAFVEVTRKNTFHPIKEYLESNTWDGVPRIETLFIDYLGAEDSHYTRQVTRKMLIAGVKRIYEPGCKFDYMLVLIGPQGAGKSSLIAKLGRKWFSDSLRNFDNKEAGEHLQNAWIFELGELSALRKAEIEEVKAFLSKTEDRYRVAYDRIVSDFPRKCIFFGSTNNREFLKDTTGNRRFWPVDVNPENKKMSHWDHLTNEVVGQIWAEALELYRRGESLELDREAEKEAEKQQGLHMQDDPREGIIKEWLDTPQDNLYLPSDGEILEKVCAAQIWAECLDNKKGTLKPWEAKEICSIMRKMPDWEEASKPMRIQGYGQQKVFIRKKVKV